MPGDVDTHTFHGDQDEIVGLWTNGAPGGAAWCIYRPDGALVSCSGAAGGGFGGPLPDTGTYTITEFDLGSNEARNYDLNLIFLTEGQNCGTALSCNGEKAGFIDPEVEHESFRFRGYAGEDISLDISSMGGLDAAWCLRTPSGAQPLCSDGNGFGTTTLTETGIHTVYTFDLGSNDTGAYDLGWWCLTRDIPALSAPWVTILGLLLLASTAIFVSHEKRKRSTSPS